MKQIKVALTDTEYDALCTWSHNSFREPLAQAHFFIQQGLERRYQHANISPNDIKTVLSWLKKIPLAEPAHITAAIKRLYLCIEELPKETNTP